MWDLESNDLADNHPGRPEVVTCVAFPGENNAGHAFDGAAQRVDNLTFAELRTLASAA